MPEGLALYVRKLNSRRHGSPKAFAKRCQEHGLRWMAIGGVWQESRSGSVRSGRINTVSTFKRYADALRDRGLEVFVWGYPWQGHEERFRDMMLEYDDGRVLLDPELGANPTRQRRGPGKLKADEHATLLVKLFAEGMLHSSGRTLGLSTFGGGWRIGWFPLLAFTKAMVEHFGGHAFIGGQTYTDDGVIDRSIADMQKVIHKAGGDVLRDSVLRHDRSVEVVPNFGTYTWVGPGGKRGKRVRGAKAKAKTPEELRAHFYEFIDEDEPVDALIGWAENFVNKALWQELAAFADMLKRGACRLGWDD